MADESTVNHNSSGVAPPVVDFKSAITDEQKYLLLLENAHENIYIAQDGMLKYVNPATVKLLGYEKDLVLSKPFIEFIHPEDRHLVMDRHLRRLRGEKVPDSYSFRLIASNSAIKWVQLQATRIQWEGKPATINFVSDVTMRKLAEDTLRKSEREKTAILDAITEIVLLLDTDLKIITSNSATQKHFNVTAGQIDGKYCYKALHGLNKPCSICPVARTISTGEPCTVNDFSSLGKRWFLRSYPVKEGDKLVGIVETVVDITERKLMEEALLESKEMYTKLVDTIPDIIVHTDLDGKIIFANDNAVQISGYSRQEAIGRDILMFVAEEDRAKMKQHGVSLLQGWLSKQEYLLILQDGRKITFEVNADVLRNADGKPAGFVFVSRNIEDRKRIEMEREKLIVELREALSQVKTLSGLLPICAACKKIRNDQGNWEQMEVYIRNNSEADFSHGICPECARELYPGYYDKNN